MKAAVFHDAKDIRLVEVPEARDPGPGEIRIRVTRCGICGTDCHEYLDGPHLVPVHRPHPGSGHSGPTILGHEFIGTVEAVGDSVDRFGVGDRVACGAAVSCGTCEWCRGGRPNICATYYTLGLHADGGLAELATVPADTCVAIPPGVSDDVAALAQPLCIALHAVDRSGAGAGSTAVVIGAGGVGALAVGALTATGAKVIAVDVDERKLEIARDLGAEAVDASSADVAAAIRARTDGLGAHAVLETSGAPPAPALAEAVVRRGGRIVIVGLHREPVRSNYLNLVLGETEVVASTAHTGSDDARRAIELLAADGPTAGIPTRTVAFDDLIEGGLDPLARGEITDKVIVDLEAIA